MGNDNKVELKVSTDLRKIIQDLEALQKKASGVSDQVRRVGDELDKNLGRANKRTEKGFERVRDMGRRLADQLRGYFSDIAKETAMALEGAKKDLGLKQQFIDAAKGAVDFHDTIRKISATIGISTDRMSAFQQAATKAFASLGFSQGDAARAMEGLAGTQVRGEDNLISYGTTAAQLGNVGGQMGSTGEIARSLAEVLRARGVNQNDVGSMQKLSEDIRKILNATGTKPLEALQTMERMLTEMNPESRKKIGPEALRNLAAVSAVAGPDIVALVKDLVARPTLTNLPAAMQGAGKLFGAGGFDFDALQKFKGTGSRIGFDQISSFQTAGLSEGGARGLIQLLEHLDDARAKQNSMAGMGGDLGSQNRSSRGLAENWDATKNQIHGAIGGFAAPAIGAVSDKLAERSKTTAGSMLTMGEGFIAAAAGSYGLTQLAKYMGKGKLGGIGSFVESGTKAAALEQITGMKTTPVYVVNFSELGGGIGAGAAGGLGGAAASLTKAGDLLGKASLIMAAGAAGYEVGTFLNDMIDKKTQGKIEDGDFEGNMIERAFFRLAEKFGRMTGTENDATKTVDRKIAQDHNELVRHGQNTWKRTVKIDKAAPQRSRGNAAATPGK